MFKKKSRKLIVSWLIFLPLIVLAISTMAFDARSGTNVTIGSGEVVSGDLYLSGTNINVDGTVNGDVFAVGQTISINGTINGGITVAGQTIFTPIPPFFGWIMWLFVMFFGLGSLVTVLRVMPGNYVIAATH